MQLRSGTSPCTAPEPPSAAPEPGGDRGAGTEPSPRLRFGEFEFDPETLELHGDAKTVRLQPQPARLLHLLIANRGAVVSRDAVRRHLWPDEIHVEFDQSMNSCVKRIRVALGDSAEAPRYVETLPRLGYRFLQPVTEVRDESPTPPVEPAFPRHWPRSRRAPSLPLAAMGVAIGIVLTVLVWSLLDTRSGGADLPPRQVLAVLPFAALEHWPGAESFRQALAQELITSLAREGSRSVAVVARDPAPEPETSPPEHRVHADFVLDGRVQHEQGRLRVWAHLLLAKDGTVIWTEAFDGVEAEILMFQAEVSARIGDAVLGRLEQLAGQEVSLQRRS